MIAMLLYKLLPWWFETKWTETSVNFYMCISAIEIFFEAVILAGIIVTIFMFKKKMR